MAWFLTTVYMIINHHHHHHIMAHFVQKTNKQEISKFWPKSWVNSFEEILIWRLVVNRATLGLNQSERSIFLIHQSEDSIQPTWPWWRQSVPNMVIFFTWPHGESNIHTQRLIMNFLIMQRTRGAWLQVGRVWGPSDVTPIFTLIYKMKIRGLLFGGRSHEQWMRPWNVMVET